MDMGNFSGSTSPRSIKSKYSIMMENGGVAYQMEKAFIKNIMVHFHVIAGDSFCGTFKNGLKHGFGQEYFENGDFYKG